MWLDKRIFRLRTEKKLSQAKLAEQVSMSGNSISNIENENKELVYYPYVLVVRTASEITTKIE